MLTKARKRNDERKKRRTKKRLADLEPIVKDKESKSSLERRALFMQRLQNFADRQTYKENKAKEEKAPEMIPKESKPAEGLCYTPELKAKAMPKKKPKSKPPLHLLLGYRVPKQPKGPPLAHLVGHIV